MGKIIFIIKWVFTFPLRLFSKVSIFTQIHKSIIHPTAAIQYGSRIYRSNIGKYTYINNNCWIINSNVGNFCSIANNVMIGGGKHPLNFVSTSPVFYSDHNVLKACFNKVNYVEYEETSVGNDVWIGSSSFIKGGITIGSGAVIGAYSVVTKDVEPYSIVAGNPAKIIRKRFDDPTIEKLIESQWWNYSNEILKEKAVYFENVEQFLHFKNID